jgi:hypothetical protein
MSNSVKEIMIENMTRYLTGKMNFHQANVMIYLEYPAGIGEHSDIMGTIEEELSKAADYSEKLDQLKETLRQYG